MKTLMPNLSKPEGPLTVCNCPDTNVRKEQRKCLAYCEGKKGYHQLVLALIMMDIFRPKRIEVIVYDVSKTCD
jgi:hypothetical protein